MLCQALDKVFCTCYTDGNRGTNTPLKPPARVATLLGENVGRATPDWTSDASNLGSQGQWWVLRDLSVFIIDTLRPVGFFPEEVSRLLRFV